jgi:hypothetical protein
LVLVVIKERERRRVFLLLLFAERGGEKRGERRRDVKKERRGGKMDEMRVPWFFPPFCVCPPSFLAKTGGGLSIAIKKNVCILWLFIVLRCSRVCRLESSSSLFFVLFFVLFFLLLLLDFLLCK